MSSLPNDDLERQVEEALKGKRLMPKPKSSGAHLPLTREVTETLNIIGQILGDSLDASAVRNVVQALTISEGACFCDRCSNPLGTQVKMVPTANGPTLELVIACSGDDACSDQNMSIPLWGEDDDEEEAEV